MERFVLAMDQIAFGHGAFLFLHGAISLRSCWGSETPILGRSNPHAGEIADLRRGEALPMRSVKGVQGDALFSPSLIFDFTEIIENDSYKLDSSQRRSGVPSGTLRV